MNALNPIRTRTEPERLKFTLTDVDAMVRAGLMPENARVELIDGDLIHMASEGGFHANHKVELVRWFVRNLPDAFRVGPDMTLRLSQSDAPEPDLYIFPTSRREEEVRGPDLALVIELSDTTLSYDLRRKALLYASFDVQEYWVVEISRRQVHVHTRPGVSGYETVSVRGYDDQLTPDALPGLVLRLSELDRLRSGPPA